MPTTATLIPVSRPSIAPEDIAAVHDAMTSGWVSSLGPYIERFERDFAAFCGVEHCVTLANGTVAIHLALKVLGIGPGDEVIVPDLTFVATANAVVTAGATPVICDVRASDWCMDAASVERLVTPRTKAIIPVHLYGHPCDMDAINAVARRHGIRVIEDAAEAHGAEYRGRRVGGLGDCATFSFYGNKIITTGEGGAITTNSAEIAEHARYLRDHGMSKTRRYWHTEVGYNYRMTNIQAALGVAQLERVDRFIAERDRLLRAYHRHLDPHGITMNPALPGTRPVNWITCALLDGVDRDARDRVLARMKESGVDTRPFFYPLTALPMYPSAPQPVSADLSARGLNLPTFPELTDENVEQVSGALVEALRR